MYTHTHTHTHMNVYIYVQNTHTHTQTQTNVSRCVCVYMYTCIKLCRLAEAKDWQAVIALECEALAVAEAHRHTYPEVAESVYNNLGACFHRVGQVRVLLHIHTRTQTHSIRTHPRF